MTWGAWVEKTFGTPFEIWHDGLNLGRFEHLSTAERNVVAALLPEGIAAGDHVAAVGARMLEVREVVPDLEARLPEARGRFLAEAARAVTELGGDADLARRYAIEALATEPFWSRRIDSAIGLRHLPHPDVVEALLDSVASDPDYLVRYHSAESLLAIGGIEPLAISDHGELFSHVASDDPSRHTRAASTLREMLAGPDDQER